MELNFKITISDEIISEIAQHQDISSDEEMVREALAFSINELIERICYNTLSEITYCHGAIGWDFYQKLRTEEKLQTPPPSSSINNDDDDDVPF